MQALQSEHDPTLIRKVNIPHNGLGNYSVSVAFTLTSLAPRSGEVFKPVVKLLDLGQGYSSTAWGMPNLPPKIHCQQTLTDEKALDFMVNCFCNCVAVNREMKLEIKGKRAFFYLVVFTRRMS